MNKDKYFYDILMYPHELRLHAAAVHGDYSVYCII